MDLDLEQEEVYARKMGVSVEEIEKALKLQGEGQGEGEAVKKELNSQRGKFKQYVAKHWKDILVNMSIFIVKI